MTRTQLYLPESQYEELKTLAETEGVTFAAFTRKILEYQLNQIKKEQVKNHSQNSVDYLLKSLTKVEKWQEKNVIRKGSTQHDAALYGRKYL